MEQVLLNLLDNAIKFSDSGEIAIGVVQERGSKYLYVKDAGTGIGDGHDHRPRGRTGPHL